MNHRYFLAIFFSLAVLYTVTTKIQVKLRNLQCSPSPRWFMNVTCKLRAVSWSKTLINIEAVLKKTVTNSVLHVQLFKQYGAVHYQPFLINISFEFCSLVSKNKSRQYFFTQFTEVLITKYSNLNHSCPYNKDEVLIAKDVDFAPSDFFDISIGAIGSGKYRLDVHIYPNGLRSSVGSIIGYGDVTEEF